MFGQTGLIKLGVSWQAPWHLDNYNVHDSLHPYQHDDALYLNSTLLISSSSLD